MKESESDLLTLFLSGDVMTGRGIDQVLTHSVTPRLYERYAKNAKRYVELAEQKNGPIPAEVSYKYIWGDAFEELDNHNPDARIINLETSVTTSGDYWKGKGIHYRMHPENAALLTTAGIDICVLGNNHIMDWGYAGLKETLNTLHRVGLKTTGAGFDRVSAAAPAVLNTGSGRLLVFSYGTPTAGVPMQWGAENNRPGVNLLSNIDSKTTEKVAGDIREHRKENDRVVVSLHWGSNWGYEIPERQQVFAHRLIDSGTADLIHGHSSHHRKAIEVYKGRLILYGCGDLISDYEGISGHEKYRDDLVLLYFPALNSDGELISLKMSPMQLYRFQLRHPPAEDVNWLHDILNQQCKKFVNSVKQTPDGQFELVF